VRAEWSGAMRCGHRVWIHALARCGSAAAIAIARSNTSFGECRCGYTSDGHGCAYRTDHCLASKIEPNRTTFRVPLSSRKCVRMTNPAPYPARQERLSPGEQPHQKLAEDRKSIELEIASPETKQVAGRLTNNR